jgi:hypothetical protein
LVSVEEGSPEERLIVWYQEEMLVVWYQEEMMVVQEGVIINSRPLITLVIVGWR